MTDGPIMEQRDGVAVYGNYIGGAWTAAFVNRGGRWVVIQEHLSDAPQP